MSSTSILSSPTGPNELLTIFEIDCAAITNEITQVKLNVRGER